MLSVPMLQSHLHFTKAKFQVVHVIHFFYKAGHISLPSNASRIDPHASPGAGGLKKAKWDEVVKRAHSLELVTKEASSLAP